MDSNGARNRLLTQAHAHIRETWGYDVAHLPPSGVTVAPARCVGGPLAVRVGDGALLLAEPRWQAAWQNLAATITVEQLFSIYGVFELARTTLPNGVSPFGPVWCFLGDRESFRPGPHDAVAELDVDRLRQLSTETFWHCSVDTASRGFAVTRDGQIAALATVWQIPGGLWEIGVDVLPISQGHGRGKAAVSAAAAWILERAPLVYYTTGAFNVPSCRTARSLGLLHVYSFIKGLNGPFQIPPGPLGRPLPDVIPQPYWREYPT